MCLDVVGDVQGVELRVGLHLLGAQPGQPLGRVAAGAEPDGIDAEVPKAAPAVDDLLGNAAVDAAQRHGCGSRLLLGRHDDRRAGNRQHDDQESTK